MIETNTKGLEAGLLKLRKKAGPEALEKAMGQVGVQLVADVVTEYPSVPKDEGTLEGSTSFFVGIPGKVPRFGGSSKDTLGIGKGKPVKGSFGPPCGPGEYRVIVGVNGPQAARLHEHPEFNFTKIKSTAGGWYISEKLRRFRKNYLQIIAHVLKEFLK